MTIRGQGPMEPGSGPEEPARGRQEGDERGTIHVFIGTKAQYIKTAPLLRLMDDTGVEYRLVDSGQHAELTERLREELDVRSPDAVFGGDRDVTSIPGAVAWAMKLAVRLPLSRRALRREFFDGRGGVCVVHGDTPTTLLALCIGRRAGLRIAHLEAGLRSGSFLHPFPEELIRIAVMRFADVLFAPSPEARRNLEEMQLSGAVVELPANTTLEAVRHAVGDLDISGDGPALVTTHRVENLARPSRLRRLVGHVVDVAQREPVQFVAHGPTLRALKSSGLDDRLEEAGVEVARLLPHGEFVTRLARARFVITDGGSIQEECYYLGVPTLLWRKRTERSEGIGENVVISGYDDRRVRRFLADPQQYRRRPVEVGAEPSRVVLDHLQMEVRGQRPG